MMRTRVTILALALLGVAPSRAFADATLFLGTNTTPENRMGKGFAVGMGVLVLGVEFEYASATDDVSALAPSLTTGMGNLLVQTPVEIFGMQPYLTFGAGIYRETLDVTNH